jgi:signal transduction histidine kinase
MIGRIDMQRIATAIALTTLVMASAGDAAQGIAAAIAIMVMLAAVHALHAQRRALRRRDEQLSHTAHELRTPLASVMTALELVRGGHTRTPEETAEFLAEADLAARHLAFLVNDVLDRAALDAGRLRIDTAPFPVTMLLADAAAMLGLQAERRGIALHFPTVPHDLFVQTDARRFLQVLFNLVGNAVKFSAPGQPIRIETTVAGGMVRFSVHDEGAGVPATLRDRLFTAYGRGDQSGPGTGLGLYITRGLVKHLGGDIGYRPRQPRGSEFWFTLPLAGATPGTSPLAATSPTASRQPSIAVGPA